MKLLKLIASVAMSFAAGGIGSLATIPNIPTWYARLDKPPYLPPNEVFGPVWTTLYTLMGVALYLVWVSKEKGSKKPAYAWFGVQLALNAAWSLVFFGTHNLIAGSIVILMLIVSIVMTMRAFAKFSRTAMWLLAPYLAWVSFATYLTLGVTALN